MRILIVILLFGYPAVAQTNPAQVYSKYTRLGMNGNIKTVTTYKYSKLKFAKGDEQNATGTLYSVIKNWYDTTGRIVQDSTAIYYNPQSAVGYCKTYNYDTQMQAPVILITTRFDCMPPYNNKATVETIVELKQQNDSVVAAIEYSGSSIKTFRKKVQTAYRFFVDSGLIRKTVFDNLTKNRDQTSGTATYKYDRYNNFTETTLTVAGKHEVIQHKISHIDDYGNATRMLNYVNKNEQPEFMTVYEFEYYE